MTAPILCPSGDDDLEFCDQHGDFPHHHIIVMGKGRERAAYGLDCPGRWCNSGTTLYVNDREHVDAFWKEMDR